MQKKCPVCGTNFTTTKINKKYCSDHCRDEANRKPCTLKEKVCIHCGKTFKTNYDKTLYCSGDCRMKAYSKREAARQSYTKVCDICGVQFVTSVKSQTHCKYCIENMNHKETVHKEKKSHVDTLAREAFECGLSYGYYVAMLKMGQTYEQLKAKYDARRLKEEW